MSNLINETEKGNKIRGLASFLEQKKFQVFILLYALFAPINSVYAAEAKWNAVIDFLVPWVGRLGGAITFIGAIMFALGFKDDDAESKSRGLKTLIAGCMIIGIALSSSIFLY